MVAPVGKPANKPVINLPALLLFHNPHSCPNPSAAIGSINIMNAMVGKNAFISHNGLKKSVNNPITIPIKTPVHREQSGSVYFFILKHRSGF